MRSQYEVTGRDCRQIIARLAPIYPEQDWKQYLLWRVGARPSCSMPHDGERAAAVDWLVCRQPYVSFEIERLGDTIFPAEQSEIDACEELVHRASEMEDEEYHRHVGRALSYPPYAIDYFISHLDSRMPSQMDSRIKMNDMLREGDLTLREWELLDLVPWTLPPSEEAILRAVEVAEEWADALPDMVGYVTSE